MSAATDRMAFACMGVGLGVALGPLVIPTQAQEPALWPAPYVCDDELLADYELREELIFDLMMDMRECRQRFGGCAPDSTWVLDQERRAWREDHPETQEQREEREERERREREQERVMEELEENDERD